MPAPLESTSKPLGLDERILQVEMRLIDREQQWRVEARHLGERVSTAVRPRQIAVPVGAFVLAAAGLTWALRRHPRPGPAGRRTRPPAPPVEDAVPPPHPRSRWLWVHTLGLAWPLLPPTWRARMSPATAVAAGSLGLHLLRRLIGRRAVGRDLRAGR